MLAHDRHVGDDRARIGSVARYPTGVLKVVEEEMLGSSRRHHDEIWAHGIAILKEESDLDSCVGVACVQDADCLMTRHEWSRPGALAGNKAFRNRPMRPSHSLHQLLLLSIAAPTNKPLTLLRASTSQHPQAQRSRITSSQANSGCTRIFRGGRR